MNNHQALSTLLAQKPLWRQSDHPIWLSSCFTLKRNLASFPFPAKINNMQEQQLLSLLRPTLIKVVPLHEGLHFDSQDLSPTEKEALAEHFLSEGEAKLYLIDSTGCFLIKVQEHDHLTLSCLEPTSSWKTKWENLSKFERSIGQIYDFAFSPKFGYLTSDPTFCGTGLIVEAILHVPCLIHLMEIEEILEKTLADDVIVNGFGNEAEYIGDFLIIKNRFTLGVSEDHILDSVHTAGTKLMKLEALRREKLKEEKLPIMRDKIFRAYGLLCHCFQIETKEAFAALSLLKLGIDLQWVNGVTDQEINANFFSCRRAHLALDAQENFTPDQLTQKRAAYLKKLCTKLKLTI